MAAATAAEVPEIVTLRGHGYRLELPTPDVPRAAQRRRRSAVAGAGTPPVATGSGAAGSKSVNTGGDGRVKFSRPFSASAARKRQADAVRVGDRGGVGRTGRAPVRARRAPGRRRRSPRRRPPRVPARRHRCCRASPRCRRARRAPGGPRRRGGPSAPPVDGQVEVALEGQATAPSAASSSSSAARSSGSALFPFATGEGEQLLDGRLQAVHVHEALPIAARRSPSGRSRAASSRSRTPASGVRWVRGVGREGALPGEQVVETAGRAVQGGRHRIDLRYATPTDTDAKSPSPRSTRPDARPPGLPPGLPAPESQVAATASAASAAIAAHVRATSRSTARRGEQPAPHRSRRCRA